MGGTTPVRGRMALAAVAVLVTGGFAGQALADAEHSSAPVGSCPNAEWTLVAVDSFDPPELEQVIAIDFNGNGSVCSKTLGNGGENIIDDKSHQKPKD
jgi:hypothetical protein